MKLNEERELIRSKRINGVRMVKSKSKSKIN